MRLSIRRAASILGAVGLAGAIGVTAIAATPATSPPATPMSADPSAQAAYHDIEATLGFVPGFFKAFPEAGIAGAWGEFKTVQLNPKTALSGKMKELIGLAVASQIPCTYCIYFHTAAARANGASDEEMREAVAMAAISRHWSTVLNGMQIDLTTFKKETNTVLHIPADKSTATQ